MLYRNTCWMPALKIGWHSISTLLGLVHDADFVKGLIKDFSEMRESSVTQYWIEEGRKEGWNEASVMTKHEDLLVVLKGRFGPIDSNVAQRLANLNDTKILTELIRFAAAEKNMDSFLSQANTLLHT